MFITKTVALAVFAASLSFAAPAFADQDNAVADAAAQTLAAAQVGGTHTTQSAAPVDTVRCFRRSNGAETEIACPASVKELPAQ